MLKAALPIEHGITSVPLASGWRWRRDVAFAAMAAIVIFAVFAAGGIGAALAAILLLGLAALALAKPDIATVAVVFTIYANLAPVAVRSHGVPKVAAVSFFLLV